MACTFSTSEPPKVARTCGVLYILTWKCASRHNGVHFFDISTSKSGPKLVCFAHVDFQMCFAPQRRALFRHLNVIWTWCVLYILTSKSASPHNGVQFFISHLARWLRTRRFSERTFRASGATNHWKHTVFRDFLTFSRTCIFFLLILPLLFSSLFYSSLLSDSSHLGFSSVHIVGSLTSKLPSTNTYTYTHTHIYTHIYSYIYTYIYTYIYIHTHIYICIHVNTHMHIEMA